MIPGGMSDLTIPEEDPPPHDPLCPGPTRCACDLIVRVRAEERYDSEDNRRPFQDGYLVGRTVASLAIKEFAEPLHRPHATHYPGCWQSHVACALAFAADVAANEE